MKIVLISAFCIRVLTLIAIICLGDYVPSLGFIGNTELYDDYRYEEGAVIYAEIAQSLFDVSAFTYAYDELGDWTGHNLDNPFISTPLWYWICCVIVYLTDCRWIIRILNITLSIFTIKILYDICTLIFNKRAAVLSAKIISYFPYFVVFSCFSYKDSLIMFATFGLILEAIKYKYGIRSKYPVIKLVIYSIILLFNRSGLPVILFFILIVWVNSRKLTRKISRRDLLVASAFLISFTILMYNSVDIIIYKYHAYNTAIDYSVMSGGRFIKIFTVFDLWKLPLNYVFSVIQPINLFSGVNSWYSVISNINIVMCPIAIGSLLYILFVHKNDSFFIYSIILYYFISSISSILVFRQLYSLLPIPVMFFSSMWVANDNKHLKTLTIIISGALVLAMIIFFLTRNVL